MNLNYFVGLFLSVIDQIEIRENEIISSYQILQEKINLVGTRFENNLKYQLKDSLHEFICEIIILHCVSLKQHFQISDEEINIFINQVVDNINLSLPLENLYYDGEELIKIGNDYTNAWRIRES